MTISFIVTTYNVGPYIEKCLSSLAQVAKSGDQVVFVDDASEDDTLSVIREKLAGNLFGADVKIKTVFLGTNTPGGVGSAANIGLKVAECDTVFFVDGDDWINPIGFNRARAYWGFHNADILLTNYRNFDTQTGQYQAPADSHLWSRLKSGYGVDALRLEALKFIGVPWRKFYRRAFLDKFQLRFPEGDFFFEDNPFHWETCLRASKIDFTDRIVCFHRINRPGQTMASTGVELLAFFTHFETIRAHIPAKNIELERQACRWLLENMAWHVERLAPAMRETYAEMAAVTLGQIEDSVWDAVRIERPTQDPLWSCAQRLRNGDIEAQIMRWDHSDFRRDLERLDDRYRILEQQADQIKLKLLGRSAARKFRAFAAAAEPRIELQDTSPKSSS